MFDVANTLKNYNPSKDIYDFILDLDISSKFNKATGFLSSYPYSLKVDC